MSKQSSPVLETVNPIFAVFWMSGAIASFMSMAVSGRELSAELSTAQIMLFRCFVGLVAVCLILQWHGWFAIRTRRLDLHAGRAVAHFAGQFGWFIGISMLPLAHVVAIEFTAPLWTALLAVFFLGELMSKARIIAILAGFAGMLIILRPGLAIVEPGSLIVLGSAFCYSVAFVVVKKLSSTDHPLSILFYMNLFQLPIAVVLVMPDFVIPSPSLYPWILAVGLAGLTAHYCMARAMQLADATVVIPLDFLRLPGTALIGWLAYHETLEWYVLIGALVMMLGNYQSVVAERRRFLGIGSR